MTLGDIFRNLLEGRRKDNTGAPAQSSEPNSNDYIPEVKNIDDLTSFSNKLSPKERRNLGLGSKDKVLVTLTSSVTSRSFRNPDGSYQTEVIIKKPGGDTEKRVTVVKDGKKITTVSKLDPSDEVFVVQNVDDMKRDIVNPFNFEMFESPAKAVENDRTYFFNKFFMPSKNSEVMEPSNEVPVKNLDDQIDNIIRNVSGVDSFEPASEIDRRAFVDSENVDSIPPFVSSLPSLFDNDIPHMLEKFFPSDGSLENFDSDNAHQLTNIQNRLENAFKTLTPKTQSVFDQYGEHDLLELSDEETPFNKLIPPNEEKIKKLMPQRKQANDLLQKIKNLANLSNNKAEGSEHNADNIDDLSIIGKISSRKPLILQPWARNFDTDNENNGKIFSTLQSYNTQMINGKTRSESASKDTNGNTLKNISYKDGNKIYTVRTIIDRAGNVIKKEKDVNFPESELEDFKNVWSKKYHNDFDEK